MSIETLCSTHRVTIQRRTMTRGAMGDVINAWATIAGGTNKKCRVVLKSPHEASPFKQDGQSTTPRVYFYYDPEVSNEHRFVYVDKSGLTRYLYVRSVDNPHQLSRFWKVDCTESTDVP